MNDTVIFRRGEHFLRLIKGRILPLVEDKAGIRLQLGKADLRTVGKRIQLKWQPAPKSTETSVSVLFSFDCAPDL